MEEAKKAKIILQRTKTELDVALATVTKEAARYETLERRTEEMALTLEARAKQMEATCHIRHTKQRGQPMKERFVQHTRTLLATGASARSVREQLLLDASFFLMQEEYGIFSAAMPSKRYFQLQREGLGNESLVYSFLAIAKCEEVCQWGFDETSLDGIPTLNQWCRVREGGEYRNK